jgi:NADH-quinone oxidoreductase subunit J
MPETVTFYAFAALAVAASVLVIGQRNPMYSVLLLIASFGALSGLYIQLEAPFVAVAQIIIYAGAIMVLFLFVIMLLDIRRTEAAPSRVKLQKSLGLLLGAIFFIETVLILRSGVLSDMAAVAAEAPAQDFGTALALGRALFTSYLFPLQLAAVLLFVALIGAIVLSKRRW